MPVTAVTTHLPGWGSWSFNPIIALALVAAVVTYTRMYRRASEKAATPPNAGHWVPYALGIVALVVALFSPLDTIGDRYLLSAHMMQHVLLTDIAPALLIIGLRSPILPLGLSRNALLAVAPGRRSATNRFFATATSPWVALPLWAVATWVWAIPAVFDYTSTHTLLHVFEHMTLFYTGLALWWLIVDPLPGARQRPNGQRLALLGFTRLASAAVCVPLTWLTTTEYPLYAGAARGYGLSAIADQRLAGASMCFVEIAVFGVAFVVAFMNMLSRSEARIALVESAGVPGEQY
jgi:cytochrome c oxidase assembly factor CtaG